RQPGHRDDATVGSTDAQAADVAKDGAVQGIATGAVILDGGIHGEEQVVEGLRFVDVDGGVEGALGDLRCGVCVLGRFQKYDRNRELDVFSSHHHQLEFKVLLGRATIWRESGR